MANKGIVNWGDAIKQVSQIPGVQEKVQEIMNNPKQIETIKNAFVGLAKQHVPSDHPLNQLGGKRRRKSRRRRRGGKKCEYKKVGNKWTNVCTTVPKTKKNFKINPTTVRH